MQALKALGVILLALVLFRVSMALMGPPGAVVAAVILGGWWAMRSAGLTVSGVVRELLRTIGLLK